MTRFVPFDEIPDQTRLLNYLDRVEWGAGEYLRQRLVAGTFHKQFGETAILYFLFDAADEVAELVDTNTDAIVGFCSLVEQDFNPVPQYRPWIAFVYVDPAYRGKKISAQMIRYLESEASKAGWSAVHIVTRHRGLYERYGYQLIDEIASPVHERDYVYQKPLGSAETKRKNSADAN